MTRPETLAESRPGLWRVLREFWPYILRHRTLAAGSLLALLAEVGFRLLEPWPLKFVLDRIIVTAPAGGRSGVPSIDALAPGALLVLAAIGVVIFSGLRAVSDYASTVGVALVGNRVLADIRGDLYRHLQRLSLSFHTRARGGDLIVRVISDIGQLRDVAVTALLPLGGSLLVLAGMVAVMMWLNSSLALVAVAIFPIFWIVTQRLGRRIQEVARRQRRREGAMAATAAESMSAIKVVQALSLEERFAAVFSRSNRGSLTEGVRASRLAARLERTVDVLVAVATALVLYGGARLVLTNAITPGDLVVFLSYLKSAFKPIRNFAKYAGRLAKATAAGERILELLQRTPDVRDLPGALPAGAFRGAVRFAGVSFAYDPGHPVLHDIDIDVSPGQRVALVGPSGSGKSTLMNLLLRLYDPTDGRVMIDGRDIREYTIDSLRGQISVVLQDNVLFAATVRENIAFGAPEATAEDIEAAARIANAHEFITDLPNGYDTVVGERGLTLSHGQRQRIAIARAATRSAPILIFDEPTLGLDEENERAVADALARLAAGRTAFLITHDLQLAAGCNIILYLESGRVLEHGSHEALVHAGGRYAALSRLQSSARTHGARHVALPS